MFALVVLAPRHNGVAKQAIGNVVQMATSMLLHAATRWPEVADASLWHMLSSMQHLSTIICHMVQLASLPWTSGREPPSIESSFDISMAGLPYL